VSQKQRDKARHGNPLALCGPAVPREHVRNIADVGAALVPDMQGIGSGPDVMSHPPRSASPPPRETRRPLADAAAVRRVKKT